MVRRILQRLAGVQPTGVGTTHFYDVGQRHHLLEQGQSLVVTSQEVGTDIGVVRDHASALRLLQQTPHNTCARLQERRDGARVQDPWSVRQGKWSQRPVNVEGVIGRTVGRYPGGRRRGLACRHGSGQQDHTCAPQMRGDGIAPLVPANGRQQARFHVQQAQAVSDVGRRSSRVLLLPVSRLDDVDQSLTHNDDVEGLRCVGSGAGHAVPVSVERRIEFSISHHARRQ